MQGSDAKEGGNVDRLRRKGVRVQIGHDAQQIEGAAAVVVSSAIPDNNPEVLAARQAGIPVVKRADMLAELMRVKTGIAISGTHGKTTTTAMIGQMLEGAGFDPTVINGGIVHSTARMYGWAPVIMWSRKRMRAMAALLACPPISPW